MTCASSRARSYILQSNHEPQTLKLHPHDSTSFSLMVELQCFRSLGVEGVVHEERQAYAMVKAPPKLASPPVITQAFR